MNSKEFFRIVHASFRTRKKPRDTITYTPMGDVVRSMGNNEDVLHGPLMVYVVNFSTKYPHRHRFCFPICKASMESGKLCGESLELGAQCTHDSLATGNYNIEYQFQVLLSDAANCGDSKLIQCSISAPAALLLGKGATEFTNWLEQEQFEFVRDLILRMLMCEVLIRVQDCKPTVVNILTISFPVLNGSSPPSLPETAGPSSSSSSSSRRTPTSDVPLLMRYTTDRLGEGELRGIAHLVDDNGTEDSHVSDVVTREDDERDGNQSAAPSSPDSVMAPFSIETSSKIRDKGVVLVKKIGETSSKIRDMGAVKKIGKFGKFFKKKSGKFGKFFKKKIKRLSGVSREGV